MVSAQLKLGIMLGGNDLTAVMAASAGGHAGLVEELVRRGANADATDRVRCRSGAADSSLTTALVRCLVAALSGRVCSFGWTTVIPTQAGRTALIWAARLGMAEAAGTLVRLEAKLDAKDEVSP